MNTVNLLLHFAEWGINLKFNEETRKSLNSFRFKVWLIFLVFTIVILLFVYISQTVLLPVMYEHIKTQESVSTAFEIKKTWMEGDFSDVKNIVDHNARTRQMDILIHIPSSQTGGHALTYSHDSTGSSASINRRISDEMVEELYESKTGMLFFPIKDDVKQSFLLATYVGDSSDIKGYIFIYTYLEPTGTTTEILKNIFITSSAILVLFSFIVSFFISNQVSMPIIKLSKSANKLITGEFNVQPKPNEYTEIKILTENLNTASAEIARTEALRRDLLANVSHDLRTPLTMIKAYAEMIRDLSGDSPEKREKHLKVIIDETDRLTLLVSDILNLSKLQSGVVEMDFKHLNFSMQLKEIISRFSMLENTQVDSEIQEDIYITADSKQLGQAVYNLITNAINYSEDGHVIVKLYTIKNNRVRFEVTDNGIGIPEEQLQYIWERYYKVGKSENFKRSVKGTGLGLSIVKGVFENHKFQYGVNSEVGKGSTFWFECAVTRQKNA